MYWLLCLTAAELLQLAWREGFAPLQRLFPQMAFAFKLNGADAVHYLSLCNVLEATDGLLL
eukprot:scaffold666269_cov113-Prasinocladus_malaysianus.AAC.1